jgi:PKD repeat protein
MKKMISPGFRIDEKVIYSMIFMMVLSSAILAFRFNQAEPCTAVRVAVNATDYFEGSLISFKAETTNGRTYHWDFNDGTKSDFTLPTIQHAFINPGTYVISVLVNGHCEGFETVTIKGAPVIARKSLKPEFIAPVVATINKPVTFEDTTSDATSWEWRFGETDLVDGRTRKSSWVYRTPGVKNIYLKINGRQDRVSTTTIYVKDADPVLAPYKAAPKKIELPAWAQNIPQKPLDNGANEIKLPAAPVTIPGVPAPAADKPGVFPPIEADEMILMIQGAVSGEKKMADFYQYFCDQNIDVTYNGVPMKFNQMFNTLREFKKLKNIKKPEVQLSKKSSTNCVVSMIVNVHKRSRFDIF